LLLATFTKSLHLFSQGGSAVFAPELPDVLEDDLSRRTNEAGSDRMQSDEVWTFPDAVEVPWEPFVMEPPD
jgi:hypothetical protein